MWTFLEIKRSSQFWQWCVCVRVKTFKLLWRMDTILVQKNCCSYRDFWIPFKGCVTARNRRRIQSDRLDINFWGGAVWRGSWRGGPNPISHQTVFFKSQLKSHNPSLCFSNWNPIPIFLLFLFHESQSQCTKSHFPASEKGKSQLPFYPFMTLFDESFFKLP